MSDIYFVEIIHMDDYDTRITQRLHRPKLCFSMNEVVKHIGEMMIEYISIEKLMHFTQEDPEYHHNGYIQIIQANKSIKELVNSRDHYTSGILNEYLFDWKIHRYHNDEFKSILDN